MFYSSKIIIAMQSTISHRRSRLLTATLTASKPIDTAHYIRDAYKYN